MAYYTGFVGAVPVANRQRYIDHVRLSWPLLRNHGALRLVEAWGVDVPRGKVNGFPGAVTARDDENVIFAWLEWPDRETADAAAQKMQDDPAMKQLPEMPFDGMRMMWGGFDPVFDSAQEG